MSWTRRAALGGVAAGLAAPALARPPVDFVELYVEHGWAVLNLANGKGDGLHADRRFPMCSTFKWLLAAHVLSRVDAGAEHLDRGVAFTAADIMDYAPASKIALAKGGGQRGEMTVDALCEAAVTLSDNTAANVLLGVIGGPAMLTAWLRTHGDPVTRLDHFEPAMNYVERGGMHDTTTPAAMIGDLHRILFGDVLKPASRQRLMAWLLDCKTGETRLKAGLPAGWRIAQKTGTLNYHPERPAIRSGAYGDVGVLFPPTGEPILIAAYTSGSARPQAEVDAWFASVARAVVAAGLR
jgi:beta-lactamase class A